MTHCPSKVLPSFLFLLRGFSSCSPKDPPEMHSVHSNDSPHHPPTDTKTTACIHAIQLDGRFAMRLRRICGLSAFGSVWQGSGLDSHHSPPLWPRSGAWAPSPSAPSCWSGRCSTRRPSAAPCGRRPPRARPADRHRSRPASRPLGSPPLRLFFPICYAVRCVFVRRRSVSLTPCHCPFPQVLFPRLWRPLPPSPRVAGVLGSDFLRHVRVEIVTRAGAPSLRLRRPGGVVRADQDSRKPHA